MSLVEVLVTLVAGSVGLLGVAALQLVTLRSNQEAHVRLQASTLAASILDRIRLNRRGFLNDDYSHIAFNGTGLANTRAGADLADWQSEIDSTLPGSTQIAAGALERAPNTNIVTVTIRWGARQSSSDRATSNTLKIRTEI